MKIKQMVVAGVVGVLASVGAAAVPLLSGEASGATTQFVTVNPADLTPAPTDLQPSLIEIIHASKNPPCSPEPGGC